MRNIYTRNIYSISYDVILNNPIVEFDNLFKFLNLKFNESFVELDNNRFVQKIIFAQARGLISKQEPYAHLDDFFPDFLS